MERHHKCTEINSIDSQQTLLRLTVHRAYLTILIKICLHIILKTDMSYSHQRPKKKKKRVKSPTSRCVGIMFRELCIESYRTLKAEVPIRKDVQDPIWTCLSLI